MMNMFLWVILGIWLFFLGIFAFVKRTPHGWVQFRTGLVLRFLPPLDSALPLQLRNSIEAFVAKKLPGIKATLPVDTVEDIVVPTRYGSISARVYRQKNQKSDRLLILMHGGGWCIGSSNSYEEVSRRLVRETGLPLISIDYSLAPEAKFPQAHEECVDAVTWITQNDQRLDLADRQIVLVGDSAGGNLIITTTYDVSPEVRMKIDRLIAVYPAVDNRKTDYPSLTDYANGYYLTQKSMRQFTEAMIDDPKHLSDIRLSPLYQKPIDDFPETFVLTAEFDPLRDQAEAFASKLHKDSIPVKLKRYTQTIHAFFGLKDFGSQGVLAIKDIDSFLNQREIRGLSKFS